LSSLLALPRCRKCPAGRLAGILRGVTVGGGSSAASVPGEAAVAVFVSSVMRPTMKAAREAALTEITARGWRPWLFERTPASQDGAVSTYLRKVRDCDVFVWLTDGATTEPVAAEVREALANHRPVLCLRIGSMPNDSLTGALVDEVGAVAKWHSVADAAGVRSALAQALNDMVARGLRGSASPSRLARLDELDRRSRARCRSRWVSAGVTEAVADQLAKDRALGRLPELHAQREGVVVVCDELGAGKSLAGERAHQDAIADSCSSSRVPVWVRARDIRHGLEAAVRPRAEGLGAPEVSGAHIVVDGVDEADVDAFGLLEEAREIAAAWPDTLVVITSRPAPGLDDAPERMSVGRLENDDISTVAALAGNNTIRPDVLPQWVRDAARRPLFALLLGGHTSGTTPHAPHELIARLVDRAVAQRPHRATDMEALTRLAAATTDRAGPVAAADFPGAASLAASGLLDRDGDAISFALPLVEQWFAARALTGIIALHDILRDPARLSRWRYPLAVAVAQAGTGRTAELLTDVARHAPALLAWVITESIASGLSGTSATLPASADAGRALREAMQAHVAALDGLAPYATPVRPDGTLPPLGIATEGQHLTTSWWEGSNPPQQEVADLADPAVARLPGWARYRSGRDAGRPGWAWRYVHDIAEDLRQALNAQAFPVPPALRDENDWALTNEISGRGPHATDSIPAATVINTARRIEAAAGRVGWVRLRGGNPPRAIPHLIDLAERIEAAGRHTVAYPWPARDLPPGGWVWSGYTATRLADRVREIYSAALAGYLWLVDELAPAFRPFLATAAAQPAIMKIKVTPANETRGFAGSPAIAWRLEPLPDGHTPQVEVAVAQSPAHDTFDELGRYWGAYQQARPATAAFTGYTIHHGVADVFGDRPATDLAYSLLSNDLKRLRWLR